MKNHLRAHRPSRDQFSLCKLTGRTEIINALETERAKRLTPRAYQVRRERRPLLCVAVDRPAHTQSELFALAQKSNVIIRGDTGTGKTCASLRRTTGLAIR
jgi:Cdc6-like AAA superfamily ATPase